MSDFYDRLEDQLVVAARRRQAQGPVARAAAGRGRMLAATVAVAVLVVAVALALPAVLTNVSTNEPATPPPPTATAEDRQVRDTSLAGIRVAVYNATGSPNLGHTTGAELRSHGARVFVFGSVPVQAGGRSVVRYVRGAEAQARRVATVLGVPTIVPYEFPTPEGNPPGSADVAVIVLVGYDQQ